MLSGVGFGVRIAARFSRRSVRFPARYQHWKPIEQATLSYGHGISVSLLQLARAYTIFATGGELQPLTLVRRDQPAEGKRIISERTALAVRIRSSWW
jgi:cell division protein FtsI (penicillin-binding protein 3)